MIREHSAHLAPLSVDFRTWLYITIYTYIGFIGADLYIYIGKLIFLMTHSTYLLAFGVAFKCQQILLVPDWEVPDADETLGVVSQLSMEQEDQKVMIS